MPNDTQIPRRDFMKAAAGLAAAPAILAQKSPNDTIGISVIGVGTRGHYLMRKVQGIPGVEVRSICDLYKGNIERAKSIANNPELQVIGEWEKAIEDPRTDAVIIATPDFWHAPMAIRAAKAKKDIYVEKGLCLNLKEARDIRKSVKDHKVVLQLGHDYNSMPTFLKAKEIFQTGELGKVPLVRTCIDRTNSYPEWQFYTNYEINQMPADASPETIDWNRFVANASKRPFDAERFFTWRRWWEYGNGIAGDLMSHLWDSVNMVAGMGIPESAVVQGGNYFWKDGRDVPDMWNVLFDYPKKELAVTFNCTFNSKHVGEMAQYLGRDKTLEVAPSFCRTFSAEWKPEQQEKLNQAAGTARQLGRKPEEVVTPDFVTGKAGKDVTDHLTDWLDAVRARSTPRVGIDRAWEEAVAIMMSVEAYRRDRKVKWDPAKEAIV
jgi:predicted dehydrogenase